MFLLFEQLSSNSQFVFNFLGKLMSFLEYFMIAV